VSLPSAADAVGPRAVPERTAAAPSRESSGGQLLVRSASALQLAQAANSLLPRSHGVKWDRCLPHTAPDSRHRYRCIVERTVPIAASGLNRTFAYIGCA
jgi:hypothetical protein